MSSNKHNLSTKLYCWEVIFAACYHEMVSLNAIKSHLKPSQKISEIKRNFFECAFTHSFTHYVIFNLYSMISRCKCEIKGVEWSFKTKSNQLVRCSQCKPLVWWNRDWNWMEWHKVKRHNSTAKFKHIERLLDITASNCHIAEMARHLGPFSKFSTMEQTFLNLNTNRIRNSSKF